MGPCCDKVNTASTADFLYLTDEIQAKRLVMKSCPPRVQSNGKPSQQSTINDSQLINNPQSSGLNPEEELYPQIKPQQELKLHEQGNKLLINQHQPKRHLETRLFMKQSKSLDEASNFWDKTLLQVHQNPQKIIKNNGQHKTSRNSDIQVVPQYTEGY